MMPTVSVASNFRWSLGFRWLMEPTEPDPTSDAVILGEGITNVIKAKVRIANVE